MPTYLLHAEPSVTASMVRASLGLRTNALDGVIDTGIAAVAAMVGGKAHRRTLMIPADEFSYAAIRAWGRPVALGHYREWQGRTYRSFTVLPEEDAVEQLRVKAIQWAFNQPDVTQALYERRRADGIRMIDEAA